MYTNRDMRNALLGAGVALVVAYFLFGAPKEKKKEGCGCS